MGGLFGGDTVSIKAERIGSMRIQTSAYGMCIPLVYGRTRITGNLIWYGDFRAIEHVERQGGKGGGGEVESTTYTYQASVAIGLCEGEIGGVRAVWRGKEKKGDALVRVHMEPHVVPTSPPYTITITDWVADGSVWMLGLPMHRAFLGETLGSGQYTAHERVYTFSPEDAGKTVYLSYIKRVSWAEFAFSIFTGTLDQAPWQYLVTKHPDQALSYPGVAYVAAANYDLDSTASLENHSFEVIGRLPYSPSTGIYDANPKDVLVDFLTNPMYGAGFPQEKIGDLTQFSNYCLAAGVLISPYWAEQRSAHEYVTELARIGNSAPVWSEGKLKLVPYADRQIAGIVTYTPNVVPVYDLTDDDFLVDGNDDPVKVRRKPQADAYNQVQVEFSNRANDYNIDVAEAKDQADIELYGLRPAPPESLHAITDAGVARMVASTLLERMLHIRNQYELRLGWKYALLEPMDIVTLTSPALGLDRTPVRIIEIREDEEGGLSVLAEEFLTGVSSPALHSSSIPMGYAADYNVSPGSVEQPVFFEPPIEKTTTGLEVWVAVSGSNPHWGGADIWCSLDGDTYKYVGSVRGGNRYGTLKSTMGTGDTATASVRLAGKGGQLLPGTAQEAQALVTLCWVGDEHGGEFLAYQNSALVAENEYDLSGLVRGAYGTSDTSHPAGQRFVRVDETIVRSEPLDLSMIGKTIYFKFVSYNIFGGGKQTLDEVTPYAYTITGNMVRLPPSDVTGFTAQTSSDRTLLSWSAVPDVDLAEYEVREGTVWDGAPTVAKGRFTTVKLPPKTAGTHRWMVKAIDRLGNESRNAASTSLTVAAPSAVSVTGTLAGKDYELSWSQASASYDISHYEIRHGPSWGSGSFVTTVSAQSHKAAVSWVGNRTFWVAAVDLAGNVGTPGSVTLTISPPAAPAITSAFSGAQVVLSWNEPAASLPIAEYEVRHGASWSSGTYLTRVASLSIPVTVDWGGTRTFWVAAVDINGNVGAPASCAVTVDTPSQPSITAEVIDNNVLLRWTESAGTLPIDHYEIRRGPTWASSAMIGTLTGRFSVYFESSSGTYTYWVAGVDTAGNVGTPGSVTATVSQPPDFRLLYDQNSAFGGTKSNCVVEDGVLYGPVNTTETWEQHFASRSWGSPQDQVSAGYPYYLQPTPATGHYEETIDYGAMVASTMITVTANRLVIFGSPSVIPTISVSADGTNWTDYPNLWQVFATNFRYVRVRIGFASSGGDDLVGISQLNIKLAFKLKSDAGSGYANASDVGGTWTNFNESFVDIESINVTAVGTSPVTAVYDFLDAPNPAGFRVLLFDANGNRVSGAFSWSAKGV